MWPIAADVAHSIGHVQTASNFFAGSSEVSDYSLDRKQQSSENRHSVGA